MSVSSDQIRWALTILSSLAESAFYGTVEIHFQKGEVSHLKVSQTLKPEPRKPFKEMTAEEYRRRPGGI